MEAVQTVPVTSVRIRRFTSALDGLCRKVQTVKQDGPPGTGRPGRKRRSLDNRDWLWLPRGSPSRPRKMPPAIWEERPGRQKAGDS